MRDDDEKSPPGKVRLDKWLWAARFFKTRVLAAEAIDGGKVDVNGDRAKRAKLVQATDEIRLRQGPIEWQLRVKDVAERRGSAEIAQRLYEETADGKRKREAAQEQLRQMPIAFAFGDSKPGKRDRRAIRRLKGDAS
ncbi:RNA-binding S4 domain-containing protein [Gemmatimonas sp.]|uniref:RNA-binding S4 domain-containing protein n=1 Tax=Gemmatimonas sp. TaxID=1962908 RepID=UPI003563CA61